MMFRYMALAALVAVSAGCNLSDPLTFPGDSNGMPNNDNNDNNDPDGGDGDGGDDDAGDNVDPNNAVLSVTVENVTADSQQLPAQIPAQSGAFTISGDITVDSYDEDSPVQVVVGLLESSSAPTCLFDGMPSGGVIAGTSTMDANDEAGTLDVVWAPFQEANCGAAIARGEMEMMFDTLGSIEFTEPLGLTVEAVDPPMGGVDVAVDADIVITLDGPPDAASVTGRVTLSSPTGNIPSTVNVSGNTIILTPSAPLMEFKTPYTVNVTAGIQSGTRQLESDFSSSFRTVMFIEEDADGNPIFYRAQNEFHGNGFSLAIDAANQCVIALQDDTAPEQRFRFVANGAGWSGLSSATIAVGRVLDGGDGSGAGATGNCAMRPAGGGRESAQEWSFEPLVNAPGAFNVHTAQFGRNQALDATNDAPSTNPSPRMQPTTDVPRQRWRWTRL